MCMNIFYCIFKKLKQQALRRTLKLVSIIIVKVIIKPLSRELWLKQIIQRVLMGIFFLLIILLLLLYFIIWTTEVF